MPILDFKIDPGRRIRARPPVVLRRTTEAVGFIRKMTLSRPGYAWRDVLQSFEAARDEWSAMEAVVHLELLLEAGGLLIEQRTAYPSRSLPDPARAALIVRNDVPARSSPGVKPFTFSVLKTKPAQTEHAF